MSNSAFSVGGTSSGTGTVTSVGISSSDLTVGSSPITTSGTITLALNTVPVTKGGTDLTSATAYAVLCGGTTSTSAFQSIASVGTSGHVLTSNGAGALPTFQASTGGGIVVQRVSTQTGAVQSGSGFYTINDSIPQITDGNLFLTLAITPQSAANILVVNVTACLENPGSSFVMGGIFNNLSSDCLSIATIFGAAGIQNDFWLQHEMTAGTTSPITFYFRAGGNVSSLTTLNGTGGSRTFGGVNCTIMQITEYTS